MKSYQVVMIVLLTINFYLWTVHKPVLSFATNDRAPETYLISFVVMTVFTVGFSALLNAGGFWN